MKSLLLVEIVFSWGFMVHSPHASGSKHALPYPPPSTLIGALANPYARSKRNAEILLINDKFYNPAFQLIPDIVSYSALGYIDGYAVIHEDPNRSVIYPYMRPENREEEKNWFAVYSVGKTFVQGRAVIAYIVDKNHVDELSRIAWGIHRIGSKEGIVAVKDVITIKEPEVMDLHVVETLFPAPVSITECIDRSRCEEIEFWKTDKKLYGPTGILEPYEILEEYYIPSITARVYGGKQVLAPREDSIVLNTPYSPLIVPEHVFKGDNP